MKMYCDIKSVCDKYGLVVFLGGGSALGTIRHHGFIPWDDDLDLNMPREDYEKLLGVLEKELGDEYNFSAPNTDCVDSAFLKIYKKGTILSEIFANQKYQGVWIDVFPIDYAPETLYMQKLKGFLVDALIFVGISLFIAQKNNNAVRLHYKEKNKLLRYKVAIFLNKIFPIQYKSIYNLVDKILKKTRKSKVSTVAVGRARYAGECISSTSLFPPRELDFDGLKVNVYKNVEEYLRKLYGDYMKIPSPEERECHYVSDFYIPKGLTWKTIQAKNYHLIRK